MILDTSVIIAILRGEPGFEELEQKVGQALEVGVGAPTLVETAIVLAGRTGSDQLSKLEAFLRRVGAVEIPFGVDHWRHAYGAFWRFGKGRHPAALNFGDCCSYATAKVAQRPLLCKGSDFSKTDLELA
ncbi:MAG: type II toxin-antitoxin system VapC family toxin [Myxococcota bacterium]